MDAKTAQPVSPTPQRRAAFPAPEADSIPSAAKLASWEKKAQTNGVQFPPLASETRTHLPTDGLCFHLGIAAQTARIWACKETFPAGLKPIRLNSRLRWPVAGIKAALGVAQ